MYDFYSYFETTGICSVHKQKHHFSKPPDIKHAIFFPNTLSKGEATLGIYCNHGTYSPVLLRALRCVLMSHIAKHYIFRY